MGVQCGPDRLRRSSHSLQIVPVLCSTTTVAHKAPVGGTEDVNHQLSGEVELTWLPEEVQYLLNLPPPVVRCWSTRRWQL